MRFVAACLLMLLFIPTRSVRGEDAPAYPVVPRAYINPTAMPAPPSAYYPAPATHAAASSSSSPYGYSPATPALDKSDHLLKAAEHLEAAGLPEQAKQMREQHEQFKLAHDEALLQQRLAELQRLQAEVDDLKRKTGREGQILVHVQALEISLDKLRDSAAAMKSTPNASGASLVDCLLKMDHDIGPATVLDRAVAADCVDALREQKLLKVLAEPTLVTVEGRPVFFNSGGEFPILVRQSDGSPGVDFKKYGTQVDLVAKLMGSRKIRIETKFRVSELDSTLNVTADGVTIPGLHVREVDTGVEMELGKTAIIGGIVSNQTETIVDPKTNHESEVARRIKTVFLVTPELVETAPPHSARADRTR
jgi:hypothetical protein